MKKSYIMKTLYMVKIAVMGADKAETIYFETREQAFAFYHSWDHCDKPVAVRVREDKINDLLARMI